MTEDEVHDEADDWMKTEEHDGGLVLDLVLKTAGMDMNLNHLTLMILMSPVEPAKPRSVCCKLRVLHRVEGK